MITRYFPIRMSCPGVLQIPVSTGSANSGDTRKPFAAAVGGHATTTKCLKSKPRVTLSWLRNTNKREEWTTDENGNSPDSDGNFIKSFLEAIEVDVAPKQVIRLGKKTPDNARPVEVIRKNAEEKIMSGLLQARRNEVQKMQETNFAWRAQDREIYPVQEQVHLPVSSCAMCVRVVQESRLAANTITCIDDIDGFDLINDDDRVQILQMIHNTKAERKRPFDEPKDTLRKSKRIPFPSELGYRPRLFSVKASTMKIMYTNADQLTPSKKMELIKRIELHKPLIVAVCEAKPKYSFKKHNLLDYDIPD